MKLVRQVRLEFREGTSDKVYEVDLCEVGDARFVVNFRYGRRGTSLKEGSKTAEPVLLHKAEAIFEKLVRSKVAKGYREIGAAPAEPLISAEPLQPLSADRDHHLLKGLQIAAQSPGHSYKGRNLDRLIWRVGQRRLAAAAPILLQFIDSTEPLRVYCTVWSLGRLGDTRALPALQRVLDHEPHPEHVRQMAYQAIYALSDPADQAKLEQQTRARLPEALQVAERAGVRPLLEALVQLFQTSSADAAVHLLHLYNLPNSRVARQALVAFFIKLPLGAPRFQVVRRIFKAAAFRDDHEVFGILAYRFDTSAAECQRIGPTSYFASGKGFFGAKELRSEQSKIAFSNKTRDYLRAHVWRELRRHAEEGDATAYVKKAMALLLPMQASDGRRAYAVPTYDWSSRRYVDKWFAERYDLFVFNHILFGNSSRLTCTATMKWRYRDNLSPQSAVPEAREEAFPEMWDQMPQGFMFLLAESQLEDVHRFAVKGLKLGQHLGKFENDAICMMLMRPFEVTQQLGLDEARRRFRGTEPDADLVLSLLQSPLDEARTFGLQCLEQSWLLLARDLRFLEQTFFFAEGRVREHLLSRLKQHPFDDQQAQALLDVVFKRLLNSNEDDASIDGAAALLLQIFPKQLAQIPLAQILPLLQHSNIAVQAFAAEVLLIHDTPAEALPTDLIAKLMHHEAERLQVLGVRLFAKLPLEQLIVEDDLILGLCLSEKEDLRSAVRPIVAQLAQAHQDFGQLMTRTLALYLLQKQEAKLLHRDLVTMLRQDLGQHNNAIDAELVERLMKATSIHAKDLGGQLFIARNDAHQLPAVRLVQLASFDIVAVRIWAQQAIQQQLNRLRDYLPDLVHLLDSKWDDTRAFGFELIREHFDASDFSATALVTLCDSQKHDVQRFGSELITRCFNDQDGPTYLLRLGEHPSSNMQLFVTNFLQRFAAGQPERLPKLFPYFQSVLGKVNRGRTAKTRVLNFLKQEALAHRQAAELILPMLTQLVRSVTQKDKAECLQTLVALRKKYPDLTAPFQVVTPPRKEAVHD